jgi:hypothetical protein
MLDFGWKRFHSDMEKYIPELGARQIESCAGVEVGQTAAPIACVDAFVNAWQGMPSEIAARQRNLVRPSLNCAMARHLSNNQHKKGIPCSVDTTSRLAPPPQREAR